jgi:hypothetical protein
MSQDSPPINKDKCEISNLPRSPSTGHLKKLTKAKVPSASELPNLPSSLPPSSIFFPPIFFVDLFLELNTSVPSYMRPTIASTLKMKDPVKREENFPKWKINGHISATPSPPR